MSIRTPLTALATAALSCALFSGAALGQAWPTKPIKVVTVSAGGGLDTIIRLIGPGISGSLGQPIVVENRPSTTFPQDGIAKGVPDGYTLGYFANAVWLGPLLRENMPYDPIKDFSPISLTMAIPNVLVVPTSLPVSTVQELVALTKSKPNQYNIYMAGGGSVTLATILFEYATGAQMTSVRYKGVPQGLIDLQAGRIHTLFPTLPSALPLIKSGKIKALGVTSGERSPQAPDLHTMVESGYKGFELVAVQALLAPPKTPAAVVGRMNQEIVRFLAQPDIKAKATSLGNDVIASSPAYLTKFMQAEIDRMTPVFKAAGIKPGDMSD